MHARKSSLLRRAGKVLLAVAAAGYLAIVLLMTIFQRHLVFAPRTYSLAAAQALAAQNGFAPWTNATGEVIGWKLPAQSDSAGSVLIAHGKGGSALDEAGLGHDLQKALSVDVYLLEYPGYGHRGGSPSEATVLEAADDAWQLLPTNRPAYAVSVSLGTGVAAHLAQKFPTLVAGVLMFVPYDRLASVAQHRYPFLPAYFLLVDRFNPTDWLEDYHGPVKIVIAGADETIPPACGQNLYDRYAGPKALQIIPNASHGGTDHQSPAWWRDTLRFWQTAKSAN